MSREVKVRAWMPKEKKWYKGGAIQLIATQNNSFQVSEPNRKIIELSQYTGLRDKNNVEIYEGDIVRCFPDDDPKEVVYCADRNYTAFDLVPDIGADSNGLSYAMAEGQVEVIGNIYENPELAK